MFLFKFVIIYVLVLLLLIAFLLYLIIKKFDKLLNKTDIQADKTKKIKHTALTPHQRSLKAWQDKAKE